jgi:hypothetical protein
LDVGVGCFRFFNIFKKQLTIMEDNLDASVHCFLNYLRIIEDSWAAKRPLLPIIFLFSHFPPYFNMVGPMHFSFLSFQILFLLFLSFPITYFPFFLPTIFLSLHLFPNPLPHVSLPISFNHLFLSLLLIFLSHSLLHVIGERSKNSKKCEKIGKEEYIHALSSNNSSPFLY